MIDTLKALAKARQLEELTKKAKQDAEAEFQASAYYQALNVNHAQAVAKTNELTEQLRKDALDIYNLDGEKKPSHGGFEIKMSTEIVLKNEEKLRDWLFTNFRPALKTDEKMVVKAAKDGNVPAEFYVVDVTSKVYIKTDLSKFLEEEAK